MINSRRFFPLSLLFVVGVTVTFPADAAYRSSLLPGADETTVSRGVFLKAAIESAGLPHANTAASSYPRVPRALLSYVNTAEKMDALDLFGRNLLLARPITRGEALVVLAKLLDQTAVSTATFKDVLKGSPYESAVALAIQRNWMSPVSTQTFGIANNLTVGEARLFLRKATSGSSEPVLELNGQSKTPTIRLNLLRPDKSARYPLPKSDILETIWRLLNDEYLYKDKIDPDEAAYKAAEALVESLNDPYTSFMKPVSSKNFQNQIEGEVTGIGAQVEQVDGILMIVAPLPKSPAEKAGLRAKDQIIKVDGVSLQGLSFADAVEKVRGPKGSSAKLTVRRDGVELEIMVTRDTVKVPEIEISWQGGVAVVRIVQFGKLTDTELRSYMADIQEQDPDGIILDLRNNPGGLLHAADQVVSNFLPQGSVVAIIKKKQGTETEVTADPPTIAQDVPVVVLVNKGSASASEIVAGALQDAKRAKLVGEKTFGKGTVQQVLQFNDDSSLKMTVAEWLTPDGRHIDGQGVAPDVEVKQTDGRDEQMLRAIELLR